MATYGYARVSSKDQNVRRQIDALRAFPLGNASIYVDRCTGATFERPRYRALMRRLRAGDVLVVKSIDRLGRNYVEIIEQWRNLTHMRRVDIVVLDMPLLDTRTDERDLTGTFISDVVLQLLSYIAQVERENIRQRQAEGIAAARARGQRFGRPEKARPEGYVGVAVRLERGEISHAQAARELGTSRNTLYKWRREDAAGGGAGLDADRLAVGELGVDVPVPDGLDADVLGADGWGADGWSVGGRADSPDA